MTISIPILVVFLLMALALFFGGAIWGVRDGERRRREAEERKLFGASLRKMGYNEVSGALARLAAEAGTLMLAQEVQQGQIHLLHLPLAVAVVVSSRPLVTEGEIGAAKNDVRRACELARRPTLRISLLPPYNEADEARKKTTEARKRRRHQR